VHTHNDDIQESAAEGGLLRNIGDGGAKYIFKPEAAYLATYAALPQYLPVDTACVDPRLTSDDGAVRTLGITVAIEHGADRRNTCA